ncbi:MAG: 50S ribosomal protein L6 [Patescibacteria group bacterium]|nr:50S ribosomal protein L6 [Patescibacteria group bacterium]
MSRIGKKPIELPEGVEVRVEGRKVIVKGPKGELSREIRPEIKIELKEREILISPKIETRKTKAFWGLTRALINNMVKGVAEGYEKKLEIHGLGYKADIEGDELVLKVGFTHLVKIKTPESIKITAEKNLITVSGIDKELVGQTAARIRKVRPPEPYKGKGIRYVDEIVRRKAGKKAATAGE